MKKRVTSKPQPKKPGLQMKKIILKKAGLNAGICGGVSNDQCC